MKKRSIWLMIAMLAAALTLAFAACKTGETEKTDYKLSETAVTLEVGGTKQLTVTPAPAEAVVWASEDGEIATVEEGLITACSAGTTKVTATFGETALTCTVTVTEKQTPPPPSTGYSLNFSSLSLKTGETKQLDVVDEDGRSAGGVVYSSENATIASVSESGLVTAVSAGSTTVKATVGGTDLTCSVTVTQKYTYSLDKTSLDIAAGATETITLITTPEAPDGARPHTFTSSNPAVATVDGGSGKVKGIAKGTATITCAVDGEELQATVKVTEYTVKVDGTEMGESIELRVGEADKQITVESDPARSDVTPEYKTDNAQFVTVEGGLLHAVAEGSATVTVTVGGREFKTNVTVTAQVQYTLKADGEDIQDGAITLTLGGTAQLSVERDPAGALPAIGYNSDDDAVADVTGTGLITAKKVGTANITVTVEGADPFEISVNVILESSVEGRDFVRWTESVDLDALDENETLDWFHYYREDDGSGVAQKGVETHLVGDYVKAAGVTHERFWDYKAPVFFGGSVNTYGLAVHGSYSIEVKLTNAVSKVVLLTGAWKETATVQFKLGDVVLQEDTITTVGEESTSRMITFTVDTAQLTEELTLTIAVNCNRAHDGNVSVVAAAAIGKTSRNVTLTASAAGSVTRELEGAQNITEAGNLDWVVANGTRKAGVPANTVIKAIAYDPSESSGGDFGSSEGKDAHITWTDGTAAAPANCKDFKWADTSVTATVALTKGNFTVSVYATGWNCGYLVAVYDKNNNFINAYQGADEWSQKSHTAKIAITLDVKEAGDYTFKLMKCRGVGNQGWAAIAVSQNSEYSLENNTFDLTKGVAGQKIVVRKGGETVSEGVSYATGEESVVTVGQDGSLNAVGSGTATVTVTVGGEQFLAYVTVTDYILESSNDITLSVERTSQIVLRADPEREFQAAYVSGKDATAEVSESGLITAKSVGETDITVTVAGKTFTIHVTVVSYTLNKTEITLVLGSQETDTLQMLTGPEGSGVDGVTFSSDDGGVASVNETDGTVTAKGIGKTTVKAEKDGVELQCTVIVKLNVSVDPTDYAEGSNETVNLDELDTTNATLDWQFFRNENIHEMADSDLIGSLSTAKSSTFGDYRTHITWYNGDDKEKASYFGYTDGWAFKNSVSFPVKVTKDVKYIAIFTGAWHAQNTVAISYEGTQYAEYVFVNNGNNEVHQGDDRIDKNKKLVFTPDMAHIGEEEKTFTVTLTCGKNLNEWADNVSLVAIAVVGNTARSQHVAATATEQHEATSNGEAVNLTEVGSLDWAYICDGDNGLVTKNIQSHAIGNLAILSGGVANGKDHFADQSFKWTDGTKEHAGETTDQFKWSDNAEAICVTLTQSAKVTLWISAWQGSVDLTVYEKSSTVLGKVRVIEGDGSNSHGVKVEATLNVTEASTFTFFMKKEGGGNFGLGAITVAALPAAVPEN